MSQVDLVQIPLLPETLHPHPADCPDRAETGRQVGPFTTFNTLNPRSPVTLGFCFSFDPSLLITVLEAFHFDHETLNREMEAAKSRESGSHLKFNDLFQLL